MAFGLLFLASLTLTCLPLSWSYRDGARSESCYNMTVIHTDFLGQTVSPMECGSSCSYQLRMVGRVVGENNLTVEEEGSTTYQCGEVYKLQLVSTTTGTFEGFMVEAREYTPSFEEGSTIWGTWVTDPNNRYHAVECNRSNSSSEGPFENAATQKAPTDLTSLDLYWRAPPPPNTSDEYKQLPEDIKFWFVTVQQRLRYIYPVDGPTQERNCSNPPSPSPSLSPSPSPSPSPSSSPSPTSPSGTTQATTELPTLLSMGAFIGVIAGASGGGLLLLVLVVIIIACVCVCVKRSKDKEAEEEFPVIFSPSNNKIVI